MYTDKKKPLILKLLPLLLVALLAGLVVLLLILPKDHVNEESAAAIREAIEKSARQCYTVEGVYPPSLEYLQDHYGLQVNTDDFYVNYQAFASNLPPDVVVRAK